MALFIYFLLGGVIIGYELTRKKYFNIDLMSFFNFFFFLVYSYAPIMLILEGNRLILEDMPYGSEYFGRYYFTPYIVFLSYLFFLAGFHTLSLERFRYKFQFEFWWSERTILYMIPFAYLLLYFFLLIYTDEIGGLSKAIELAEDYRSGTIAYTKFGFVIKFFPINTVLLYYTYYKYFLEKKAGKLFLVYFLTSLLFVFLVTVLTNSRGYLIFQLLGLYVLTANYHKNYYLKYMIPTLFVAFVVIKYGKPLFNSMQYLMSDGYDAFVAAFTERVNLKEQEGAAIASYFTHPIVSLEASLQRSGYDVPLRYFEDIYNAFVLLLPNELLGIKEPEMLLMQQNTLLLQGRVADIVLPGILGYFSYAGHIIGVFIGSYIYGLIGILLLKLFINIYREYRSSIIFIYLATLSYGYFVFRGVPDQVLDDAFMYTVILVMLLFGSKLKIKKV